MSKRHDHKEGGERKQPFPLGAKTCKPYNSLCGRRSSRRGPNLFLTQNTSLMY